MCGINGIFQYRGDGRIDRGELLATSESLARRGPDAAGSWIHADERVALAHRRLAIVDLDQRAVQPMRSRDGRYFVTFNGEIYNHRQLRDDLLERGAQLRTTSDTEVLLELYVAEGLSFLERLRGMYALAIWDESRRGLLLARDPYGIKPLYYSDDGRVFRFASQVRALVSHARAINRSVDPAGLVGFLSLGSVPEPYTCHQGVRLLEAGVRLWVGETGLEEARFASVAKVFSRKSPLDTIASEQAESTCSAIRESVAAHLVSDVRVGAFLSAGVDSSALVALMSETVSPIRTVTLGFEPFLATSNDEVPLARAISAQYGSDHVVEVLSFAEFRRHLPNILADMDQPSVDGMNTWLVSHTAAQAGLKVVVSGLGGDELFGGYPSFRDVPRMVRTLRPATRTPRLAQFVRRMVAQIPAARLGVSPKIGGLLELGGHYPGAYFLRRGLFMPWELAELFPRDLVAEGLRRFSPVSYLAATVAGNEYSTPFSHVAALESSHYLRNQLLRDTDWASMAHGLEVRVPLVDYSLLQRASTDLGFIASNGKHVLSKCPRVSLPRAVTARRKTGFGLPLGQWMERADFGFDEWRREPALADAHWSRRLAYSLAAQLLSTHG